MWGADYGRHTTASPPGFKMLYTPLQFKYFALLKFVFSKKATKTDEIVTVDLTPTLYCQIDGEDFVKFCGIIKKHELYF